LGSADWIESDESVLRLRPWNLAYGALRLRLEDGSIVLLDFQLE
jgi:hypothetical protein